MRAVRRAVAVTAAAVTATGLGAAPATADGVAVLPRSPHPGQRVHISVPGCSVGPTAHVARSRAFTRDVDLYGKADTGEGDARIKKDLRPGPYAIIASCGDGRTIRGEVVVVAKGDKPGTPGTGGTHSSAPVIPPPGAKPTASPHAPANLSATPTASQSHDDSKTPFLAIGAVMAALLLAGAGTLLVRRRRD
ncbi:hypothetical protein [Actinoallomurus soli]|uniref:hypothetical protein n=1 Tax=Actinoallomurus soli TaxID=2952535 RepID=UPI002093AF51|nr:hypothetical protein [Actinoallomurus soli]MCO5967999.1 hypothetical protein [Actinoallomurus soli]